MSGSTVKKPTTYTYKIVKTFNYSEHSATQMIPAAAIVYNVAKASENVQK